MRQEAEIEQEACRLVYERLGIEAGKLSITGDTGFPDRVFWVPGGKPFFIEFKRPGEEPRPKQVYQHRQLIKLGYRVEVHDNAEEAYEAIVDFICDEYENVKGALGSAAARKGLSALLKSRKTER